MTNQEFRDYVWEKGRELYRDMPWRRDTRPYYVLVSELMLQQTQVERVVPKFLAFITAFPNSKSLAEAPLADVLKLWQGLGYNRRAKYLHDSVKMIETEFDGIFPSTKTELEALPGVGANTAGAILAYSFNQPVIFIETNIRTALFHHFFKDGELVDDRQLVERMNSVIDKELPREWYWAMMDYGSWLKRQGMGRLQTSKHYKKQSALKGSIREVRGQIVKILTAAEQTEAGLRLLLNADERFGPALNGLMRDGLVVETRNYLHLTK